VLAARPRDAVPARRGADALGRPRRLVPGLERLPGAAGAALPRTARGRTGRVSTADERVPGGARRGPGGAALRPDGRGAVVLPTGPAPPPAGRRGGGEAGLAGAAGGVQGRARRAAVGPQGEGAGGGGCRETGRGQTPVGAGARGAAQGEGTARGGEEG